MMLPTRPRPSLKTLCLIGLVALSLPALARAQPASIASAAQNTKTEDQTAGNFTLRWPASPRAKRFRLQVALDDKFKDIVLDRAVVGLEQEVSGLQAGKYYWRVAPATPETGRYSAPTLIEVKPGGASTVATMPGVNVMRPPADVGWQAVIGAVARPFAARLRPGKNLDLVAQNSAGAVYALDGIDGSALWSVRGKPATGEAGAESGGDHFTPLVLPASDESRAIVAVAVAGGVRGLDGETGRELWRTMLDGRPLGGTVTQLRGEEQQQGAVEFAVAASDPDMLYVVDGKSGSIVSRAKLSGALLGSPVPFTHGEVNGVALALDNRQLEIRHRDGSLVHAIKSEVPFKTPPLVLATPRGTLITIGTEHGLLFFEGADLKPLGRTTTEMDAPRGRLAAADLDNDGMFEIVMVTQSGRVAVINTAGKIQWAADGATDAYMATFADLNNDGVLDVIVASGASFALGLSGRDGTLLWRADDNPRGNAPNGDGVLRTLTGSFTSAGVPLLIGGDANRSAVRAVGLPVVVVNKASVK